MPKLHCEDNNIDLRRQFVATFMREVCHMFVGIYLMSLSCGTAEEVILCLSDFFTFNERALYHDGFRQQTAKNDFLGNGNT